MLSDPQSVTINTVANSLPATSREGNSSTYRNSDGSLKLNVSSTYNKRDRTVVRLTDTKDAVDPHTAVTSEVSASVYIVMDRPKTGYTVTEVKDIVEGLTAWLSSSNIEDVLGGES